MEAFYIVLASTCIALFYSLLTDGFDSVVPFMNALLIGFICGVAVAWSELVLFKNAARRMNFFALLSLKLLSTVMIVTVTIFSVILLSRSLASGQHPLDTLSSAAVKNFILKEDFPYMILYAFGMACLILFTKQMSRKMGPGILFNFISGKYAKPFHEERIFLFVDLDGSTALAETLGDLAYHRLLNDFFCDVAEPVAATRGVIHQYIGDEIVITWKMQHGLALSNCLKCYFAIVRKMDTLGDQYRTRFGVIPTFKAAIHCGTIVVGEVGDIKSEIVFHGDVINTTARIERLCSELNEKLLVSGDLLEKLPLYQDQFSFAGMFSLRGKKEGVSLYRLKNHEDEGGLSCKYPVNSSAKRAEPGSEGAFLPCIYAKRKEDPWSKRTRSLPSFFAKIMTHLANGSHSRHASAADDCLEKPFQIVIFSKRQ
jgi:adenylate cyclase